MAALLDFGLGRGPRTTVWFTPLTPSLLRAFPGPSGREPIPYGERDARRDRSPNQGSPRRDGRNGRDSRDGRDLRGREMRGPRDHRDPRDSRDVRDSRDMRDSRDPLYDRYRETRETPYR